MGYSFNRENFYDCPCSRDCDERYPACHDHCDKFKKWRKKLEKAREEERKYHRNNDLISDDTKRRIWKSQRYKNNLKSHWQSFDDRR